WCFDSLVAVACGNNGTILRTTNGGKEWSMDTSQGTGTLFDIHFQTPRVGTIVGEFGTILRTRDGGITWSKQNSWTTKDDLRRVSFYDSSNGIACGLHGVVRMTANGGQYWAPVTSNNDSIDFTDIAYISPSVVIATASKLEMPGGPGSLVKRSYVMRSTNHGVIWDKILTVSSAGGTEYKSLSFISERTGYCLRNSGSPTDAAIFGSFVFKTTDGGATWDTTASAAHVFGFGMSFINEHSGTIVGADGLTAHTSDGGETWADVPSGTSLALRSVSHGTLNGAFAVGYKTAIIRLTTNDTLVTPLSTPVSAASGSQLLRSIYPNPAHTTVTFEFTFDEPMVAGLVIYNVEGKRVGMTTDAHYPKGIYTLEYDVSNFAAGSYFVEITTDGRREMMKFIVQ
ncbi:MAG TPA: YCF48-related protein, partial [Candidatus Kapabacteria bacterium]